MSLNDEERQIMEKLEYEKAKQMLLAIKEHIKDVLEK